MKNLMAAMAALVILVGFCGRASAQAPIALGASILPRTDTVQPVVGNGVTYELYEGSSLRVHIYHPGEYYIIPRSSAFYIKMTIVPTSVEEDLDKEQSLGDSVDEVHQSDVETAGLVNGHGLRDQNPAKHDHALWFPVAKMPDTVFFGDQSKVKGGSKRSSIPFISIKEGTPEGKGGGLSPAFYCVDFNQQLTGNAHVDAEIVKNFMAQSAVDLGLATETSSTQDSGLQNLSTVTQPAADPAPVPVLSEDSTVINGRTWSRLTFHKEGVHIRVMSIDGKEFDPSIIYDGQHIVSQDGMSMECIHGTDMPMCIPAGHRVQVFVDDVLFGTYGG